MFCVKCGAEIQLPAKFCSKCGAPVEETPAPAPGPAPVYPAGAPMPGPSPVRPAGAPMPGSVPVPPPMPGVCPPPVSGAKKGKVRYGANTLVGILGAFAVFLSMFLPCAIAKVQAFGYSVGSDSVSFIQLMREGEAAFVSIVVFVCIALVVLFHMVKCPRVSLVGILGMLFGIGLMIWAIEETKSRAGGFATVSYGPGIWLYAIGIIVCLAGAVMRKRRQ